MEAMLYYMEAHWAEWLFSLVGIVLGYIVRKLQYQQKNYQAIAEGVQSLLRENIVTNYNKYQDKGYCPIYAKESIKHVYKAYHNLGGNDVATALYQKMLEMPDFLSLGHTGKFVSSQSGSPPSSISGE